MKRKGSKPGRRKTGLLKSGTIRFDQDKEVRAIARERIGTVKPSRPILPKDQRKKPKHKKPPGEEE